MQQFFDPQQQQTSNNMNGYSAAPSFQANQQSSNTFNGPASSANPYMSNSNFRQQNGVSNESYDAMQNASPNSQNQQQQGFQNYIDPRIGVYDHRTRPNFDPMSGGMHGFPSNTPALNKMRMNDLASMFNNPAAMAAFQRQRMGMYGQGRENVSIHILFG